MSMHTPLDGRDSDAFEGRDECLAHEDAGEEPNEVVRVLDGVRLVWNRTLDLQNEPFVP